MSNMSKERIELYATRQRIYTTLFHKMLILG